MSTILQFRPKTISTKTIRRRLKDFQNGRKKKQQEVSEIHDCLSQLMLRLSWSKIYCSGMVMTYAKLNCVKVFVYIITMDILYVTIIILNGLKRYFCQRPPDWISTYKTTYIRQIVLFCVAPVWTVAKTVNSRQICDVTSEQNQKIMVFRAGSYACRVRGSIFKRNERVILYDCFSFIKNYLNCHL